MNEELETLLPPSHPSTTKEPVKISPYYICIPSFFSVVFAFMVFGIKQQWLMLCLCSRFTTYDGKLLPALKSEYLPGFTGFHAIINPSPSWEECSRFELIQVVGARYSMIYSIVTGAPSLIIGPFLGMWSDKTGRKPLLLIGMSSALLIYCAFFFISIFDLGFWVLVLAGLISGLFGGVGSLITASVSYFADTTIPSERARVFAIGQAFVLGGVSIGPFLGGYLLRNTSIGSEGIFLTAILAKIVILLMTAMFLPESLRPKETTHEPILPKLKLISDYFLKSKSKLLIMAAMLIIQFSENGVMSVFFNFVSFSFGWDSQNEGEFILFIALLRFITLLSLYDILSKVFKIHGVPAEKKTKFDLNLIRIGSLLAVVCAFFQFFASAGWQLYAAAFIDIPATLIVPIINSFLSNSASENSQGLLFSFIHIFSQFVSILAGILFPLVFSSTVNTAPSLFFAISGILLVSSFVIFLGVNPKEIHEKDFDSYTEFEE